MKAFWASVNFDAFIVFHSSQPGRIQRKTPAQDGPVMRGQSNAINARPRRRRLQLPSSPHLAEVYFASVADNALRFTQAASCMKIGIVHWRLNNMDGWKPVELDRHDFSFISHFS